MVSAATGAWYNGWLFVVCTFLGRGNDMGILSWTASARAGAEAGAKSGRLLVGVCAGRCLRVLCSGKAMLILSCTGVGGRGGYGVN